MHPLDAPEQVQLLQSLKGKKNEALIVTALFTGMRAGELLGLTWDNVDFDHGVIHIVKQLTQSRGEGHPFAFGTLKNGKTRSINPAPLAEFVSPPLQGWLFSWATPTCYQLATKLQVSCKLDSKLQLFSAGDGPANHFAALVLPRK